LQHKSPYRYKFKKSNISNILLLLSFLYNFIDRAGNALGVGRGIDNINRIETISYLFRQCVDSRKFRARCVVCMAGYSNHGSRLAGASAQHIVFFYSKYPVNKCLSQKLPDT
jgi:hypothetical protein